MRPSNCLFLSFLLLLAPALASERWVLMGRHGECAPVRVLERSFPDLGPVEDPHAFAAFVRAKGLQVSLRPLAEGRAYEVRVPEKSLALVFATAQACGAVQGGR